MHKYNKQERKRWYETRVRQLLRVDFLPNTYGYYSILSPQVLAHKPLSSLSIFRPAAPRKKKERKLHPILHHFTSKSSHNSHTTRRATLAWRRASSCGFSWEFLVQNFWFLQELRGSDHPPWIFPFFFKVGALMARVWNPSMKLGRGLEESIFFCFNLR